MLDGKLQYFKSEGLALEGTNFSKLTGMKNILQNTLKKVDSFISKNGWRIPYFI